LKKNIIEILILELKSTPFAIQETGYAGFHLVKIFKSLILFNIFFLAN
jgi:hypothetical protein